jgi:hypothetical protein
VGWDFGTAATTGLLYQPQMIGDGDCGEIGGMKVTCSLCLYVSEHAGLCVSSCFWQDENVEDIFSNFPSH